MPSIPPETGCDLNPTSLRSWTDACSALHAAPGRKSLLLQSRSPWIPSVIDGEMEKRQGVNNLIQTVWNTPDESCPGGPQQQLEPPRPVSLSGIKDPKFC